MPYILKSDNDRRQKLQEGDIAQNAGELNYQIFYYIKHNYENNTITNENYIKVQTFVDNFLGISPNYQKYNDMTGALLRCGKEIERRLPIYAGFLQTIIDSYDDEIAKYEDKKILENGDVI